MAQCAPSAQNDMQMGTGNGHAVVVILNWQAWSVPGFVWRTEPQNQQWLLYELQHLLVPFRHMQSVRPAR